MHSRHYQKNAGYLCASGRLSKVERNHQSPLPDRFGMRIVLLQRIVDDHQVAAQSSQRALDRGGIALPLRRVLSLDFQAPEIAVFIPSSGWELMRGESGSWRRGDRRGQLGGRLWHQRRDRPAQVAQRRVLSLDFQAPEIAVFIPSSGWQPTVRRIRIVAARRSAWSASMVS